MEKESFKERVRQEIIKAAKQYKEIQKTRPKSLIKGNELKTPVTVDLIMRKKVGSSCFDEIVVGDDAILNQFKEKIGKIVSSELFTENDA